MRDYGFDAAQIHVLEDQRRYDQAAEVAFSERNILEGVRLLLRSDSSISIRLAIEQALYGLWTVLPFGPPGNRLENAAIAPLIQYLRSDKLRDFNKDETHQVSARVSHRKTINHIASFFSSKYFKPSTQRIWIVCLPLLRRMEYWRTDPTLSHRVAPRLLSSASHIARTC